ncbi:unnamed protein product [Gordionus sp. m RMFG-2023]
MEFESFANNDLEQEPTTNLDNKNSDKVQTLNLNDNIDEKTINPINSNDKTFENYNPLFEKYKSVSTIKKAMKSSSKFNRKLNRQRMEDRKAYFDLQTMAIHYPQKHIDDFIIQPPPNRLYPVAILPWQYQDCYKKYTPHDLKRLPLNTPTSLTCSKDQLYNSNYLQKLEQNKLNFNILIDSNTLTDYQALQNNQSHPLDMNRTYHQLLDQTIEHSKFTNDETDTVSIDSLQKSQILGDWCHICGFPALADSLLKGSLISCAECFKTGHPSCLGLTSTMVNIINTYAWQCVDCKNCAKCFNTGNEAEMMCCDKCDRGFHSFCVGMETIPDGEWICFNCLKSQ